MKKDELDYHKRVVNNMQRAVNKYGLENHKVLHNSFFDLAQSHATILSKLQEITERLEAKKRTLIFGNPWIDQADAELLGWILLGENGNFEVLPLGEKPKTDDLESAVQLGFKKE